MKKNKLIKKLILLIILYIPNVYAATCPLGKDVTQDLANILQIIQILGPIIVVVVTVIEVVKTVSKGDIQGESKKLGKRLLKRVLYCILLFFVPVLVKTGASIAQIDVASCDLSNPTANDYTVETTTKKTMSTESAKKVVSGSSTNTASSSSVTNTNGGSGAPNCSSSGYCGVAHRGYSVGHNPNSVDAFEAAGEAGFWGVECDLRMRSNGVTVCSHDASTKYNNSKATFKEYIETCKKYNMVAVVDIKADSGETQIKNAVEVVNNAGWMSNTVWQCSMTSYLNYVKKYASNARIWYLVSSCGSSQIKTATSVGAELINADYTHVNQTVVNNVHNAGMKLGAYVVGSTKKKEELLGYGVDYIMSNKPL